jgi:hypothetical protein
VEESGNGKDVATLSPVKYRGTYWIGIWVDPGPVYMFLEKRLFSCPGENRNADRSAHSVVSIPAPQAVKSSHGDESEEFRLLDCDAVLSCRTRQMFRKLFRDVLHTI